MTGAPRREWLLASRSAPACEFRDTLDVEVELDTAPREVTVAPDFAAALDAEPEVRTLFQNLSYSNKQRIVLAIGQAKTAETRWRRILQSVQALGEKRT